MESYKELEVWKQGIELAIQAYRLTQTFPAEERLGLAAQIRRAASSIPANIAEGWGRGSTKEYLQFLRIARASLMELETHLVLATRLGYIPQDTAATLQREVESLGKRINRLITRLANR